MISDQKSLMIFPLLVLVGLSLSGCGGSGKAGKLKLKLSIGTPKELGPDVLCNPPLIDLIYNPAEHVEAIQAELREHTFVEEFDENSRSLRLEIDPLSITNLLFYDHAFVREPILDANGSEIVPPTTNDILTAHHQARIIIRDLPRFYQRLNAHPPSCRLCLSVPEKIVKFTLKKGDVAPASPEGVELSDLRFDEDYCSIKFSSESVEDRIVMVGRNENGKTLLPSNTSIIRFNDGVPDYGQVFHGRVAEVDLYVLLNPSKLDFTYQVNLDPRFPYGPSTLVTTRLAPPPQGSSRSNNILTPEELDQLQVVVRKDPPRWRFEVAGARDDLLACDWTDIQLKIDRAWRPASKKRYFGGMSFPLEQKLEGGVVERLQQVKGTVAVPYFEQKEVLVVERNGLAEVITSVPSNVEAKITSTFHYNTHRATLDSGSGCRIIKTQCFNADGLEIMRGPRGGSYWGVPETVRYTVLTGKNTARLPFNLKTH